MGPDEGAGQMKGRGQIDRGPGGAPAVEKAQEAAQLPWSSGSWIFPGHFSAELKDRGSCALFGSMFIWINRQIETLIND